MPKIESFEKYSDAYDEWFEKNQEVYESELEVIRQLIPLQEARGLEIGVGSGKFAVPLGIKIGVESSKKRFSTDTPRNVGTILIGRSSTSLKVNAVSIICSISSLERSSSPKRCRRVNVIIRQF